MKTMLRTFCGLMAIALLAFGTAVSISTAGNPIIKQRSESEVEIDLGMIVEDFMPHIIELMGTEDEAAPEKIRAIMKLLGIEALDRFKASSSINDEWSKGSMSITLDPEIEGGLLADLFAVPPSRFQFGRYLEKEELAMVLFSAGLGERIEAFNKLLGQPEFRELAPMIPSDPLAITGMWGIDARKDILPLLSGELDLIIFSCGEGETCAIPKVALVMGLTDGLAFRSTMLDMVDNIVGPEKGAEFREVQGEKAGDFTFYPLWQGFSYAIAPDFGIMTTDTALLKEIVARDAKGSDPVEATMFVHLNGDRLVNMLSGTLAQQGGDSEEMVYMLEILNAVAEEPIGTMEFTGRTGKGRLEMEFEHPSSMYAAYYRMWKGMIAAASKMAAMAAEQQGLQDIVHEVDGALTTYGLEHDGTFPESLEALVEAGYLEALPDLEPTPLGEYIEGGYTYLPLRDDSGKVVGHYFFAYGGGEDGGHDVFTQENLADPDNFSVAKDGEKDGVQNFSFDGIALEHMEEWNAD
jgi:hypothetical protein